MPNLKKATWAVTELVNPKRLKRRRPQVSKEYRLDALHDICADIKEFALVFYRNKGSFGTVVHGDLGLPHIGANDSWVVRIERGFRSRFDFHCEPNVTIGG